MQWAKSSTTLCVQALLQLDDKQMSRIVLSGPTLLSRRTETLKWKVNLQCDEVGFWLQLTTI